MIFINSTGGIEWCCKCQTNQLCNKFIQGKVKTYQCTVCGTTIRTEYVKAKNKRIKKK